MHLPPDDRACTTRDCWLIAARDEEIDVIGGGCDAIIHGGRLDPGWHVEMPDWVDAIGLAGAACQEQGKKNENRKPVSGDA